jgi:hypothetical protein
MRLLVIEDEDRLSGILKSNLGEAGFAVDIAGSAANAEAALELINYDVAILDLGLPDGDGLAVLAAARRLGKTLPILISDRPGRGRGQGQRPQCRRRRLSDQAPRVDRVDRPDQGSPPPSWRCAGNNARRRKCQARHSRARPHGCRDAGQFIPPGIGDPRADDAAVRAYRAESGAGGEALRYRRGARLEPDPRSFPLVARLVGTTKPFAVAALTPP